MLNTNPLNNRPIISIVIPVKNGIATIKACLDAIFAQTLIEETEVIIIDSGSTDGTLEIIKDYAIRLYKIPPKNFNHGSTRNYGVSLAKGEFVVMTVQDAIATNDNWLKQMLYHFDDNTVAGVCGMQMIPQKQSINPFEWTRPISQPNIRSFQYTNELDFLKLAPLKKREVCGWDNVNSMYRKTILEQIPFDTVKFGEDIRWAIKSIQAGFKIVYDPNCKVAHYHPFDKKLEFDRKYIELAQDYVLLDLNAKHIPVFKSIAQLIYRAIKWRINPKWIKVQIQRLLQYNKACHQFDKDKKISSKTEITKTLFS
ncbi:glycosyltransferase family 2 protein [Winogradskyella undariae]|uniref:glycosyltransferase family 2 protein n=1 Tax=Winogradskyella undariae TaxID=1285465 RepID=UPI0015CE32AD|nr:glycosyltransferase family 2 protein [Winogradskyella undariae]